MVIAVGVDVVGLERFARALERTPGLTERLFGPSDLSGVSEGRGGVESLAARFAAKEATLKALGGNMAGFRWHDIQVNRPHGQAPELVLSGSARDRAQSLGIARLHLSLSHDAGVAIAFVVAEGGE